MTAHDGSGTRAASPTEITWLRAQLADWIDLGLISHDQARQIDRHYHQAPDTRTRTAIGRVLLAVGGCFFGIGLIWLVAANIDELSPTARMATVTSLWLVFLLGGEAMSNRSVSAPVVGAARLMAALGLGAVIFQAAQSLQVPAYEPRLVGLWATGALLHGYLARANAPFLVGIVTGLTWWFWQPLWDQPSGLAGVILLGLAAVLAAAMAVLHDDRLAFFAWTWRLIGAGTALIAMFVAATPGAAPDDDFRWTWWLLVVALLAGGSLAAAVLTRPRGSLEAVAALVVLVVATLLALWQTTTDISEATTGTWLKAAVSIAAYALLAVGLVALGTVRNHTALTWIATVALVVFTTFQSFAVFAPIVTGAWLFVVLGTVFLGTGFLVDRARRELTQALDTDTEGAVR